MSRIDWTNEELRAIATAFVEKFGAQKIKPARLREAQMTALPVERRRNFIPPGPTRTALESLIAGRLSQVDVEEGRFESTGSLRGEGGVHLPSTARPVLTPDPVAPPVIAPAAPLNSIGNYRLVESITASEPAGRPRIFGTDTTELGRCTELLVEINRLVAELGRFPGSVLDDIALHPVDYRRLKALTIQGADGLSRFEESLGVAHNR